jgi:hypothetical protein
VKQRMLIELRGREKQWSFVTYADPQYPPEWEADGLQIFILENTIPEWVAGMGLPAIKAWCWAQDAWRFLRVW